MDLDEREVLRETQSQKKKCGVFFVFTDDMSSCTCLVLTGVCVLALQLVRK